MAVDPSDLSPVLCTYVPTWLGDEFDTMVSSGVRSCPDDDSRHFPPGAFARVASVTGPRMQHWRR